MSRRTATRLAAGLLGLAAAACAHAQPAPQQDRLYTHAVASFQQGRFSEAYGRLMALANAGHPLAAQQALFMAQNAVTLFGKDWDVSPDELARWAALAGQPAPVQRPRLYAAGHAGIGGNALRPNRP